MSSVGEYLFLVSEMMLGFFVVCFLGFGFFFFFLRGKKKKEENIKVLNSYETELNSLERNGYMRL